MDKNILLVGLLGSLIWLINLPYSVTFLLWLCGWSHEPMKEKK